MNNVQLIEKSFDITRSEQYNLSIRFSPDGFSFCIFNPNLKIPLALSHVEINAQTTFHLKNELNAILHQETLLKLPFKKTIVSYCCGRQLITPMSIVPSNNLETVFNFTFQQVQDETLLHHPFSSFESTITFGVPTLLLEFFEINFGNLYFVPEGLPLFNLVKSRAKTELQLWVHRSGHLAYIVADRANQPLVYNSFNIKNETDLLYFIVGFFKQLNTNKTPKLYYSGEFEPNSTFFQQLKKYGFSPELSNDYSTTDRNYNLEKQPDQSFLLLIEQGLCE